MVDMSCTESTARQIATQYLRFQIGNLPYLTDNHSRTDDGGFVFPIYYSHLESTLDDDTDNDDVEMTYYVGQKVGEIIVTENEELIAPTPSEINQRIRCVKQGIEYGYIPKDTEFEAENN